MSELDKSQNGVKSMEVGLSILDVLIDQRAPMKLKDISLAMQMHRLKKMRLLKRTKKTFRYSGRNLKNH